MKGDKVELMSRSINTKKHFENENMRKKWKELGHCLIRQVSRRRFGAEGRKHATQFFGCDIERFLSEP